MNNLLSFQSLFCGAFVLTHLLFTSLLMAQENPHKPLVIAHRGASGSAPENTLVATQKALEMGADMVEIDLHMSKDGEVMVIHDATLKRTTNGTGLVKDHTLEELKKLDAGAWFHEDFAGEPLPTLAEFLTLLDGKAIALLEIKKSPQGIYPGIEQKIVDLVRKHEAEDWCILQSFESKTVQNFLKLVPDWEIHKLISGKPPVFPDYQAGKQQIGPALDLPGITAVNPNYRVLTPQLIERIHQENLRVFTWTVNQEKDLKRMIEMKVDGIITNYPERLVALLKEE